MRLFSYFLKDIVVPDALRPPVGDGAGADVLRLRWLGIAGFVLQYRRTTLLIDPYVTRVPFTDVAFFRLRPDRLAIDRFIPRADAVVVGHTHFDHAADVPTVARRDGCRVIGSRSTTNLLLASGADEAQLRTVPGEGGAFDAGDFRVTLVESRHVRLPFQSRSSGTIQPTLRLPARALDYLMDHIFGIHVAAGAVSVYQNGSANLLDAPLAGLRATVALVGMAGGHRTERYVERLLGPLAPAAVLPCHHDAFWSPLDEGHRLAPDVDLEAFRREAARVVPGARLYQTYPLEDLFVAQDGTITRGARRP